MRLKSLLFLSYTLLFSMILSHRAMADFEGFISIDDDSATNSETSENNKPVDSSDGVGDDEDDYSSLMTDESSNASGDEETTDPSTVDITVVRPTTKETATTEAETATDKQIREITEKTTEEPENIITKEPIGGEKSLNAEARVDKKVLRVFTTEVIAAVVLGAVCVVILIVFLIYRLRKRDEGSYALSDAGYKDTLQGEMGKEAFV